MIEMGVFVMKYTLKEKLGYVKKHLEENVPLGRREDIRHSRGTYQRNSRFNQIISSVFKERSNKSKTSYEEEYYGKYR